MRIDDRFTGKEQVFRAAACGPAGTCSVTLIQEHETEIFVNGELLAKLVCTAEHLAEMALGHLISEGVFRSADDMDVLTVSPDGRRVDVSGRTASCGEAGGTLTVGGNSAVRLSCGSAEDRPAEDFLQRLARAAAERFSKDMPLHKETRSTHCAFLMRGTETVFETEDISRHSAMDKVIGRLVISGIPAEETAVFISGRVPADVVRKTVRAGVPVLMSKELPTKEAVRLAERYGLTLLSQVTLGGFLTFSEGASGRLSG